MTGGKSGFWTKEARGEDVQFQKLLASKEAGLLMGGGGELPNVDVLELELGDIQLSSEAALLVPDPP